MGDAYIFIVRNDTVKKIEVEIERSEDDVSENNDTQKEQGPHQAKLTSLNFKS